MGKIRVNQSLIYSAENSQCKFNIHMSVHRNTFLQYNQQDAPVITNYLFL